MNDEWFSAESSRNLVWFSLAVASECAERLRGAGAPSHTGLVHLDGGVRSGCFVSWRLCRGPGRRATQPCLPAVAGCRRGRDRGFWRYL